MRQQFDVFDLQLAGGARLFFVVSGGVYANGPSVVMAPLVEQALAPSSLPIHPEVTFAGQRYTARLDLLASVSEKRLQTVLGSLADQEYVLKNAFDRLLAGY